MVGRHQQMMERERRLALYGDSPPPSREAAPYPEGEIIHHLLTRYVVRHDNGTVVTKYTTHPDGMGPTDMPNEVQALRFVKEHTTIPVPSVVSYDWDRVTMEYIEGQTLKEAWPTLDEAQRSNVLDQLRDYIAQMHALGGLYVGRLDGQGAVVPGMMTRSGGPFGSVSAFHDWLVRPRHRVAEMSIYWHQITTQLGEDYPIVFTHMDINTRNIMVRDGNVVAILDWEWAGWYPEYWGYYFTMQGLDRVDWKTLGSHAPSLFPKRFDLEYILVGFLCRLS